MKLKSKKFFLLFIISLVMILGLATIANAADDNFKISDDNRNIVLKGTWGLYCLNKPTGETVTWSSSNDSIASIDSNGKVTANAIGTATITATAGTETATSTINVVYRGFLERSTTKVNLVIGEHDSQTVSITAEDYNNNKITNPNVEWKCENEEIAKVDSNGKITAVKSGSTKVIAKVPGAETYFDVVVTDLPVFTDFSNAKIDLVKTAKHYVNLNVNNITNSKQHQRFYYCITPNDKKPDLKLNSIGGMDADSQNSNWRSMTETKTGLVVGYNLEDYVQLNQDLYLWIAESVNYDEGYYDNTNYIAQKTDFVVSGKKLERPKYPVYAEMFFATMITHSDTQLVFNIPIGKKTKRNFTLKIGKITDKSILNGIKNNKGDAWNSLLEYAKKSNAIFNKKLSTVKEGDAAYDTSDGAEKINLKLDNKAYYYMYVVFDDENGKYYPASGLTISKADVFTEGKAKGDWYMFFLGDDSFKWDDFGTTAVGGNTSAKTNNPKKLPYTGTATIGLVIATMTGTAVFFKVKNNKYKGI